MVSRGTTKGSAKAAAVAALATTAFLAGETSALGSVSPAHRRATAAPRGNPLLLLLLSPPPTTTTRSALFANSKNIRAAMEATERYGIHSPEARLAWEVVEEFDASTNDDAAYQHDKHREGLSPDDLARAYNDVGRSMERMRKTRFDKNNNKNNAFPDNRKRMEDVAAELRAIRLSPPSERPSPKIPGLWDAKLRARATTQQFGAGSTEARLAWEEVEEIASSGLAGALENSGGGDDLVRAAQACEALEELDRFLSCENHPGGDNQQDTNRGGGGDDDGEILNRNDPYNHGYDYDTKGNHNYYNEADTVDNSMAGYTEAYNQAYSQDYNNNNNNNNADSDENYYGNNNNAGGGTYR